jgi:hypothetical protein
LLSHETILDIGELGTIFEMVLGQEHVPQTESRSFLLQLIDNRWVAVPSCVAGADLAGVNGICGNAFFVDEFVDLGNELVNR